MRSDRFSARAPLGLVLFAAILLFMAGCSSTLKFTYNPVDGTPVKKVENRPSVLIRSIVDARATPYQNPMTIGKITSLVMDMNSFTLTLTESPTAAVRTAFEKELSNAGFVVVAGDPDMTYSDYVMDAVVKELRFDVGSRDDISISIMTKLSEKATANVIWSDTVSEKRNDYFGIWGETQSHISRYMSNALSKVARESIAGMEAKISSAQASAPTKAAEETGRLTVATDPAGAEIYMEDVYYGLTPAAIDIKPGVYEVTARKDGFRETKRKVSVRAGQTTELNMKLDKE